MREATEPPLNTIFQLQRRLNIAVTAGSWDDAAELAQAVVDQLKLAMNPATSQTGTVHLDGVFSVGTMHYDRAPPHAKRALHKMNRIIKTARRTLK